MEAGLRGAVKGSSRTIRVRYPEDFRDPSLAGKELQLAVTDPNLVDPQLPQARHEIHGDLAVPLQQIPVGVLRQGNGPGENHPGLDGVDRNAKHEALWALG